MLYLATIYYTSSIKENTEDIINNSYIEMTNVYTQAKCNVDIRDWTISLSLMIDLLACLTF